MGKGKKDKKNVIKKSMSTLDLGNQVVALYDKLKGKR